MTIDATRPQIVSTGGAHRARFGHLACTVKTLVSALLTAFVGLLLVGLVATQAEAHEGHDAAASFSAPQIETTAFTDGAMLFGYRAIAKPYATTCDGHCCFAGTCCPNAAGIGSAALPHPRTLDVRSKREADLDAIASAAPEGPRRPPKRDI